MNVIAIIVIAMEIKEKANNNNFSHSSIFVIYHNQNMTQKWPEYLIEPGYIGRDVPYPHPHLRYV